MFRKGVRWMNILIFTDLDGSLLNHGDYSFAEAEETLDRLNREGIPLIMTTSKTRSEVEALQRESGLHGPFIVENGGGIYFPERCRRLKMLFYPADDACAVIRLGMPYRDIRRFMAEIPEEYGVRGFGDMTVEEIAASANMPVRNARLARQREYTEPFVLEHGEKLDSLTALALANRIRIIRGGRYFHFMSVHQDKGKAVSLTSEIFRKSTGCDYLTIGIGDSPNDYPMLRAVDIPILIPPGDGSYDSSFALFGLLRAGHPGSRGWNEAVSRLLDTLKAAA
jgi:mannosyl-3-phosphoglycerate phosphatase